MTGIRPRTARITAFAAAALAAGALTATPAQAVVGTPAEDGAYPFTAQLSIGNDEGSTRGCTGVLVESQWVLSAAGCFADSPGQDLSVPAGKPRLKTTATIGRTHLTSGSGQVRTVVELAPRADRDLVLARLSSPVTDVTPIPLSTTAPAAGERLRAAGFGRTKDAWLPDRLYTGTFAVDAPSATGLSTTGDNNASICKGDTGGPLFRDNAGRYELVAVNSRSWQGGCLGTDDSETRTGAVSSRTDDITDWIQDVVRRLAIKSEANGKYVSAEIQDKGKLQGRLRARSSSAGAWERFTLQRNGDGTVSLRNEAADRFVSAEVSDAGDHNGMLRARSDKAGAWEKFELAPQTDKGPDAYALKSTASGKYVSAEVTNSGSEYGLLRARSERVGAWERFTLQRVDTLRLAPSA